jgi:demethylmenaquinone methyltransferase/2-methoxy-6-polyprenyl-1,4-benzoquinol methylase
MHDFMLPPAGVLRTTWRAYFAVMRRTVARLAPSWREIYDGLPRLIERTRWLEQLPALLAQHGMVDIRVEPLTLHGSALVSARKPRA